MHTPARSTAAPDPFVRRWLSALSSQWRAYLKAIDMARLVRFVDGTDAAARERFAPVFDRSFAPASRCTLSTETGPEVHRIRMGYLEIARVVPLMWPFRLFGASLSWDPTARRRPVPSGARNRQRRGAALTTCAPRQPVRRPDRLRLSEPVGDRIAAGLVRSFSWWASHAWRRCRFCTQPHRADAALVRQCRARKPRATRSETLNSSSTRPCRMASSCS